LRKLRKKEKEEMSNSLGKILESNEKSLNSVIAKFLDKRKKRRKERRKDGSNKKDKYNPGKEKIFYKMSLCRAE
jgi:hypothetical protein